MTYYSLNYITRQHWYEKTIHMVLHTSNHTSSHIWRSNTGICMVTSLITPTNLKTCFITRRQCLAPTTPTVDTVFSLARWTYECSRVFNCTQIIYSIIYSDIMFTMSAKFAFVWHCCEESKQPRAIEHTLSCQTSSAQ